MPGDGDSGVDIDFTFKDALTILGARKSRLVTMLDAAATVGLAAWATGAVATGSSPADPLSILDLKNEIVRYGQDVLRRVAEWRSGLSRLDRSQRLEAAHAVLVVSSYFEATDQAGLRGLIERLRLTGAEKAAIATGNELPNSYLDLIELLLREPIPKPEVHRTYVEVREELLEFYRRLSGHLFTLAAGMEFWDSLAAKEKNRFQRNLSESLPVRALQSYDDAYVRLATENPEFNIWAGITEMHAMGASLSRISLVLAEVAAHRPGARSRVHLHRAYAATLAEPLTGATETPDGIVLPSLADAYVNPHCRVAEIGQHSAPSLHEWWSDQLPITDIETFLAGYLISRRAIKNPLVILGEPGSGKSKLAEVLAARLTADDFMPILVSLRDVAAESLIQEQVEQAIYRNLGERTTWQELLDSQREAIPVILLDGFDELVQASAVNKYDYLELVRDFQRQQYLIGHPVVVIVTTRTVVADQVRFPVGSIVLQLQPFDDDQIRRWLDVWARGNAGQLAERGLQPLSADTALMHKDLAQQPLLLLMLAIFDATGNDLQRFGAQMQKSELYERLLVDFSLRELMKSARNRGLSAVQQRDIAHREVQRLAVVAVAMFNRGLQTVSEADLNADLPLLFPETDTREPSDGTRLSPAQRATARFFFVHKAEAQTLGDRVRSYEFLHSTFGEFLVAWLVVASLRGLVKMRDAARQPAAVSATSRLDDGYLYATLSFAFLAGRAAIADFLREILRNIPADDLAVLGDLVQELFQESLFTHPSRSLLAYEPVRLPSTRRLAEYSANLALIRVLISREVKASELIGGNAGPDRLGHYGNLWRGELTSSEWGGLIGTLRARVLHASGRADIILSEEDGSPVSPTDSLIISSESGTASDDRYVVLLSHYDDISYAIEFPASSLAGRVFRDAAFLPDWHRGMFLLQSVPSAAAFGGEIRWQTDENPGLLPAYLLATLDYSRNEQPETRAQRWRSCLDKLSAIPLMHEQLMLRLEADAHLFTPGILMDLLERSNSSAPTAATGRIINKLWVLADHEEISGLASRMSNRWGGIPGLPLAQMEFGR